MNTISVIIPIYNNSGTIELTMSSLVSQITTDFTTNRRIEVVLVDDGSVDDSAEKALKLLHASPFDTLLIKHPKSFGLAKSYNDGIEASKGDLIILCHADIILQDGALNQLVFTAENDSNGVLIYHNVIHPKHIWEKYSFWQKCLFSRLLNKTFSGFDGKFDLVKRSALLKTGLFNTQAFYRAGEDGDLIFRLKRVGSITPSPATIVHMHGINPDFGLSKYIYKHAQYAQAQGALLRMHGIQSIPWFARTFFREMLFFAFLTPYIWVVALCLMVAYALIYSFNVFRYSRFDFRMFVVPIVNLLLLPVCTYNSFLAFIKKREFI